MKIRHLACAVFALSCTYNAEAVTPRKLRAFERELTNIMQRYEAQMDKLAGKHAADTLLMEEELDLNPRYYRLFAPPTLYKSSVKSTFTEEGSNTLYADSLASEWLTRPTDGHIAHNDIIEREIDAALMQASVTHPDYFIYTEDQVMAEQVITSSDVAKQAPTANILPQIVPQEQLENKVVGMELKVKKPNFWKTSGEAYLQFTQNYISGNWSQGGESTNTLLSGLILKANYNDKQKIQWDNTFEAKLGFTTAPSDTLHTYRTNTDMLRLSSKLGIQAFKSWYYTIEVVSKTQITRSYQTNSNNFTSAFLSPLETSVGIGMDFKKSLKNFNISVNMAPLSYRYLYVSDRMMVASRYGIKAGHRSLQEYGSKTTINSSWKIAKNISWTSRLEAFTSYEKVIANWENTFDFAVSKYLSTKLFMHGRFDDSVNKKSGYSYFQFKEILQFGVSYKW